MTYQLNITRHTTGDARRIASILENLQNLRVKDTSLSPGYLRPSWPRSAVMEQITLEGVLSHAVLDNISNFWFRHLEFEHVIVPGIEDVTPWFSQSDAYDQECLDKFGALLGLIKLIQPRSADIIAAAKPCTPLHWISLIILLDQLPRNCFRGAKTRIVFTLFDKLALEVATQALKLGIPTEEQVRFELVYRFWFYIPMEHSERLEVQESLAEAHSDMWHDYEMLLEESVDRWDSTLAQYRGVLVRRKDSFEQFRSTMQGICESKKNVLDRFGRFPQRNDTLGRPSTLEEIQWLKES